MSDVDVMARTLYGEARNQLLNGIIAVAYVIKTRSKERTQTITEVCLAPLQFSCWNKNDPNRKIIEFVGLDRPTFMTCFGVACLVINGELNNPAPGANHYFTVQAPKGVKWPPSWASKMTEIAVIGDHRFLKG